MPDEAKIEYPMARVATVADLIAALAAYPPGMLVGSDWGPTGDSVVRVLWHVGTEGPHSVAGACPAVQLVEEEDLDEDELARLSAPPPSTPKTQVRYGYSNSVSGKMVTIQTASGPIEHEATGDQLQQGLGWPIYCKFLRIEEEEDGTRTLTIVSKADVLAGSAGVAQSWTDYIQAITEVP